MVDLDTSPHRTMRPVGAIVFSCAAGLIVLVNGLLGVHIPKFALFAPPVLISIGLVSGAAILVGSVLLWLAPRNRAVWGPTIIVFSALSLLIGGGMLGFLFPLGATFGIIGGILAIARPPAPMIPLAGR